jgi:hypothetical protein
MTDVIRRPRWRPRSFAQRVFAVGPISPSPPVAARPRPIAVVARVLLLLLVAGLTMVATRDTAQLGWVALLAVAGIPGVTARAHPILAPLGRFAEVVIVGLAASSISAAADLVNTVDDGVGAAAVLPYLAVPMTAAAIQRRFPEAVLLLATGTATLAITRNLPAHCGGCPPPR